MILFRILVTRHNHVRSCLSLLLNQLPHQLPTDFSDFIYCIYVFNQYIDTVSIDQELICSIQFRSPSVFLDRPDGLL
jgi:hypothetical protein